MPKPTVEDVERKAASYFMQKPPNFPEGRPYNCCESVLMALSEYYPEMKSDLIPRIGTVVGAGLSLTGNQCGALTGAAMSIGAVYGRSKLEENPMKAWSMGQELVEKFKERFKFDNYPTCREFTGVDMRTAEGMQKYFKEIHDFACTDRVKFAVEKAIEIIEENR
jgi:C_GCAxxG_C_C family probable redox protein